MPASSSKVGSPRVLMLQTDRHASACRRQLASLGLGTRVTGSGETALSLLAGSRWAAVVVDLDHPSVDALGIASALRTHPLTADLPILAVSATDDAVVRDLALGAGCDQVLSRPEPRELAAAIDAAVTRASRRAAA